MKRKNEVTEDLQALQRAGLEIKSPQDEYSYQPDSGSSIGGTRGKDEYGIDDVEEEGDSAEDDLSVVALSLDSNEEVGEGSANPQKMGKDFPGVSQYSANHSGTETADVLPENADLEKTRNLLVMRLKEVPILKNEKITVIENGGQFTLEGTLKTEAQKMQAREIAEAVTGRDVINHLTVAA